MKRIRLLVCLLLCGGLGTSLEGCAAATSGTSGCTYYTAFGVSPTSGTADHTAPAPGNSVKFTASEGLAGTGTNCVLPQNVLLVQPNWTSSDPLNVSISSAKDATNGTATCTGATASPVTLTANTTDSSGTVLTKTATLSCQ